MAHRQIMGHMNVSEKNTTHCQENRWAKGTGNVKRRQFQSHDRKKNTYSISQQFNETPTAWNNRKQTDFIIEARARLRAYSRFSLIWTSFIDFDEIAVLFDSIPSCVNEGESFIYLRRKTVMIVTS